MTQKMTCLEEQEIERLALNTITMSKAAKMHLLACDRCRERFLALTAVYQPLRAGVQEIATNAAVQDPKRNLIVLYPLQGGVKDPVCRLAAKGERPDESLSVVSFSDSAHSFIGRLMHDSASGHLYFYLLADDMTQTRGIQVHLPGTQLSSITDTNGFIDFGRQEVGRCREVQIILPRAVITLEPLDPSAEKRHEQHHFTLKNTEDGDIEITINREESPARYMLSFRRIDGRPTLRELKVVAITDLRTIESSTEHGMAVVQTETPERLLKIHIY